MFYTLLYKDPEENLNYDLDWTFWLEGDTIVSSSWDIPPELQLVDQTFTTTTSSAYIAGGTLGENYRISCTVNTQFGRTTKRTSVVRVTSK